MKKQPTIHISFKKEDLDLYDALVKESENSYIPISTLCRLYIKEGMNATKQQ